MLRKQDKIIAAVVAGLNKSVQSSKLGKAPIPQEGLTIDEDGIQVYNNSSRTFFADANSGDVVFEGGGIASIWDSSTGRMGIGTTSPAVLLEVKDDTDGSVTVMNLTSGDSSWADDQELRVDYLQVNTAIARMAGVYFNPDWGFNFYGYASGALNANPIVSMRGSGSFVVGAAALATDATDGFIYIPTCAGVPTGVPTTQTGTAAMVYDTTNEKLMIYNGAWVGVTLA
jgi:hypothetical protein